MTAPTPHDHAERVPGRLEQIEQRLAAATPGPWELGKVTPMPDGWPGFYADVEPNIGGGLDPQDAELIAHAPADLAALLAFARRVEGILDDHVSTDGQIFDDLDRAMQRLRDGAS